MKRPLLVAALSYVAGIAAQSTFVFYIVPAYARAHGIDALEAWAFALAAFVTAAVAIPAGRGSDRWGRRGVMGAGYALVALGLLVTTLAFAASPAVLLVLSSVVVAAGFGFFFVASTSYIGDLAAGRDLAGRLGLVWAASLLASAIAPFGAAAIVEAAATPARGLAWTAVALAALAFAAEMLTRGLPSARRPGAAPTAAALPPAALRVSVAFAIIGFATGASTPYAAAWFLDRWQTGPVVWGILLGFITLAGALGQWSAGVVHARLGRRAFLLAAPASQSILAAALVVTASFSVAAFAMIGRMFFQAIIHPVLNALAAESTGEAGRGRVLGVTMVAWNVTWGLGALAGGWLVANLGGALFLAAGIATLVGTLPVAFAPAKPSGHG